MDQTEVNRIADAIMHRLGGNKPVGNGSGITRPKELDDANTDPTLRAAVLDSYTARLMEVPQANWNEADLLPVTH
jgi:hypothetical protein